MTSAKSDQPKRRLSAVLALPIVALAVTWDSPSYAFDFWNSEEPAFERIAMRPATFIVALVGWDLFWTLPLPIGVAGHESSTVLVALNGMRLLRPRRD